ncbi:hypothetical protein J2Z40_001972 [Cytobacillus eiseniae]|uniref:DUF2953 domain-containing protein n=1 Tax=Cytobacillus eiseniae TaxID=762947 RepID=A0ABS4RGF7_9BACI|nr:DUF2953 domain-containing protein [Cytobacillus eiseniae]MBP2241409.1 hypothetical protein [Cytobacillus eiseniae]
MKWLLIALIILLLLIILLIVTRLNIYLYYYHNNDNDHLKIECKAWFGLIKYKKDIPLIKVDDNSPTIVMKEEKSAGEQEIETKQYSAKDLLNSMQDTNEILNHVISLHKIVRKFLKKISVKRFEWHTMFGLGDAAYTGMLTGGLWAVKGSMIGLLSNYMKLKESPYMTITPQFQFAVSQTIISCIFQFRIGHAIVAAFKLIKYWKGGKAKFKTKPLSALSNDKTKSV